MADNLTIRLSEETKALFNEMAEREEFANKGDFLNRLLTQYHAENIKESVPIMEPAIKATQDLMTRLTEILTGIAGQIVTNNEKHGQQLEEQRLSFEGTRQLLQQRIDNISASLAEAEERSAFLLTERESTDAKVAELLQQIERLKNAASDKDALIAEYKSKNDSLTGIISEYTETVEKSKAFEELINNLTQTNNDLQRQLERQADTHTSELNNLMLQKDRELLELRQQLQTESERRQAEHATTIRELQVEYANTVKALLSERAPIQEPAELTAKSPGKRGPKPKITTPTKPTKTIDNP